MDSLQKLKQKAYWLAYDHLASTKPARLLFFTGGGESYNPENELAERQKEMAEKGLEDELAAEFKAMSNIVESAIREGLTSAEETMIRTQMDTLLDSKITNLERVQQEKGATLERLNYIKTHENLRKAFSKLNDKQFQALTNLIETAESSIQAGNLDPKNPPDLNAANALESAWMNSDHKALGITRPGLKKVRSAAQNLVAKLEASALDNVTDEEVDEFEFEGFDPDTGAELPPEDDAPSPIDEEPTPEQDQVLAALEEEESTVEKTPEQLRAELLEQGLIRQLELNEMQFLLHNMAANHGMTENQLRQLNNKLSPRLNIKNATDGSGAYVYAEDIVYVYTSTENAIQAEIALGFREPPPQPEEIVTGEDVARAEREGQIFEAELAEEMYGQEGARIESTRQSLLEQNGLASRRASLTGTLLNRDSNLTLDSSMHNPFTATRTLGLMNGLMNEGGTWESFKPLWNHVDGRNAVENWLEEQSTFELADYDLENYLITLAKKEGFAIQKDLQDISFEKLIDSVYGSGMSGESLIIALAAQAGVGIDNSFRGKKRKELTEEDKRIKGILRNIQGDFRNDYDRMLDTLTLEISEKTYVGNGEVDITLQKADGTEAITARVPLHHVVQLQEGDLDVPLADKTEQDIQDLIDNRPESPIFVGPTGNLLALDGTNLTNNVTDGDFTKLSEEFKTERAIVAAMETIYQDVAELYDRTADLSFVDSGADESYQQRVTRARVEAFRALEGHGVAVANFGDTLDSALITGEYAGRNAEALGFIRRGGELTYEDTETGGKFIVTNEEIFDYYDGAAVVDDILDEFLTEEVSHGGKKETFNVQKGMKFLNNKLITIALRTNQELIDKYGGSSDDPEIRFQTAFRALKVKKESIIPTEGTPLVPLTADQITLIQEGYMIHSTVREAKQITEGKEAVEALATSVTELRFKLNEEQIAGLVESIVSTNPEWDNPHNRAIIAGQLRIGAGLGTLTTVDRGHQHTTTTITKVDGEVVDISSKSENLRESSIDTLFTVGLGISPINISGLDPDGRGKFNVGFSGGVNLRTGSPSAAMGVRYSVEFKNGIEVYVDGGVGTNIATLGGGVIIPAGEARIDLHGHIYPGGVELGGAVTFGNLQHSFTRDLTEAFTDNGFKDIDTALEENGGAPSREMVDMILATDDFKAVAGPYEQIFGDLGIKNARDNEFFQEFILIRYREQRSQRASEVLHGTAANPLDPANITVGLSANFGAKGCGISGGIGTSAYSQSLTFRFPTGINYPEITDQKMVADLLGKEIDASGDILSGRVPQLVPDPDNPKKMILAFEGDAHEGLLLNPGNMDGYNEDLMDDGLYLRPTQLAYSEDEGQEIHEGRTVLELDIADANGSLDIIIDPAIESNIRTLYGLGSGTVSDHYFLACAPGTDVVMRRTNLHYPQKKSGAYERTIIVITQPGSAKTYQQLLREGAPMLHRAAGERTVPDMAGSDYLLNEDRSPIMTADKYLGLSEEQQADWTDVARGDLMSQEYAEMLGSYPGAGIEIDSERFEAVVRELMDPSNDSSHKDFRIKFKDLSTLGAHPDLEQLTEHCRQKSAEMFGTALQGAELAHFIQSLTIFSFVDIHKEASDPETTSERREELLKHQQYVYSEMLEGNPPPPWKGYMKRRLNTEFKQLSIDQKQVNKMVELIISHLRISPEQYELFGKAGDKLPEGGIFGSIVGTDSINGIRITENYRDQEFYETLGLTDFSLHSENPVEQDVARAIIMIMNPLPEATKMTMENLDKIHNFVTDDFTQKIMMLWGYRNPEEHGQLKALTEKVFGEGESKENLRAALTAAQTDEGNELLTLLSNVQVYATKARRAELAGTERIPLGENTFLSFKEVQASFFVFQRCGNVSPYLKENLAVETEMGNTIAVAEDAHVRVQAQGAERKLTVGLGVSSQLECVEDRTYEVIVENETTPGDNPPEFAPGAFQAGDIEVGLGEDPGGGEDSATGTTGPNQQE